MDTAPPRIDSWGASVWGGTAIPRRYSSAYAAPFIAVEDGNGLGRFVLDRDARQ
jgi:hypothetical protein